MKSEKSAARKPQPGRVRSDARSRRITTKWGDSLSICGAILAAEYIPGGIFSDQELPLHTWSHVALMFGVDETRLYFNGRMVKIGPKKEPEGETHFVIG